MIPVHAVGDERRTIRRGVWPDILLVMAAMLLILSITVAGCASIDQRRICENDCFARTGDSQGCGCH